MAGAKNFDPDLHSVGLRRDLSASILAAEEDPPTQIDGVTIGVATMSENSPHDGEMHLDGDEFLYLISGHVRVTLETNPVEVLEVRPRAGLIVPKGVWHRVDILEPSQIVYATPGPNNEYRPLPVVK